MNRVMAVSKSGIVFIGDMMTFPLVEGGSCGSLTQPHRGEKVEVNIVCICCLLVWASNGR